MSLQDFFPKTIVQIEGKAAEYVTLSRAARSNTVKSINQVSSALLQDNTNIENGDLISTPSATYFVVAMRRTFINTVCQVHKINCRIELRRISAKYINGNKVGDQVKLLQENVPAVQTTVTAKMREYDAGLLANTVKRFLLPRTDIKELDRITLNGEQFQVDSVDDSTYEGLLYVQCSIDTRKSIKE